MTNETILRLRSALARSGMSKQKFAQLAGLHPNTLDRCDEDTWNPLLSTLTAVEKTLDEMAEAFGRPNDVAV